MVITVTIVIVIVVVVVVVVAAVMMSMRVKIVPQQDVYFQSPTVQPLTTDHWSLGAVGV